MRSHPDGQQDPWRNDHFSPNHHRVKGVTKALPIQRLRGDIIDWLTNYHEDAQQDAHNNQVAVISAGTSSGKSTQNIQWLLYHWLQEGGNYRNNKVVCTQPRRLAATSLARRVAQELDVALGGSTVGYTIAGDARYQRSMQAIFVTAGLLTTRVIGDPTLADIKCIIIDEVHERSINTEILPERKDLRVIIMSGTLNTSSFSKYFDSAPIFECTGTPQQIVFQYTSQPVADIIAAAVRTV